VHNELLLIAALEQGLPALCLFLVILLYVVIQLFRLSQSRTDPIMPYIAIGLLGTFLAWSVPRLLDYNYVLLGDPFLAAGRVVPGDGAGEPPGEAVTSPAARGRAIIPLTAQFHENSLFCLCRPGYAQRLPDPYPGKSWTALRQRLPA